MKTKRIPLSLSIVVRLSFFICMILALHIQSHSQNKSKEKKTRVRMSLGYFNNDENSRLLKASLYYIEDRVRNPLISEMVIFYKGDISGDSVIDSLLTDENGEASLEFGEENALEADDDRAFHITAYYKGSTSYTGAESSISIKNITMELMLSELEGTKSICVRAYELGNDGELFPVNDADVNFYVPRLFSDQLIGEGSFENGKCNIVYPEDIAGDTIGNISIIARIEEHKYYGNVERKLADFRWGNTQPIEEDKSLMTIEITIPTRALWHTNAPLWMIVTLIILLTGVWSHYIYVIFQLIRMSRLSKSMKDTQEE